MKLLKYKGYIGEIQISIEDDVLYGKLLYISALVSYEGRSIEEIKHSFEEAVDDYLETCQANGCEPEIPCKGSFNIRVGHELHLAAMIKAKEQDMSLNEFVTKSISYRLEPVTQEPSQFLSRD